MPKKIGITLLGEQCCSGNFSEIAQYIVYGARFFKLNQIGDNDNCQIFM